MNFDPFIYLAIGLVVGLAIHAAIQIAAERRHAAALDQEYTAGKQQGYNQCHGEMVVPLLNEFERKTGVKLKWAPPVPKNPAG